MRVHILAFGIAKEIVGGPAIDLEVAETTSVQGLKELLDSRYPRLQQLASYRIALNNEFAGAEQSIRTGDELAIIPPVSGG